ncbi:hypothetical protein BD324DRAFT_618715 [Kockovaella imperatae]|uniref:Uncharacterized protein n=1 Tax=Kockovaella imperatae TaxID=4999 RepID=A0A1Y1UMD6_9TREE|nr:hypothetical protein BD324DRAFT_618715 [Kockovaella imperatae]ORX39169.1 hypothetical protein BD324DRAFT_618715 [Kockovaella imperatae]
MKYIALGLAVAGLAAAQNSSLIPANISSTCNTFLTQLNNDDSLSNCIQPLLNATVQFSPVSNVTLNEDDINTTLGAICNTNAGCADSTIRQWLSEFYANCQAELTGQSTYSSDVRELYDVLYVANPLKAAVCSVNSANQDYCIKDISTSEKSGNSSTSSSAASSSASASASASGVASGSLFTKWSPVEFAAANLYITIPQTVSQMTKRMLEYFSPRGEQSPFSIIKPNTTTYRNTNLPFLFLQDDMTSSQLCTPCTREVFVAYIKWESQMPYALGLSQSPILGGQNQLWRSVNATCGAGYVESIISEVGSGNFASSGIGAAAGTLSTIPGLGMGLAVLAGSVALLF